VYYVEPGALWVGGGVVEHGRRVVTRGDSGKSKATKCGKDGAKRP
jgi:hypothetical protein